MTEFATSVSKRSTAGCFVAFDTVNMHADSRARMDVRLLGEDVLEATGGFSSASLEEANP